MAICNPINYGKAQKMSDGAKSGYEKSTIVLVENDFIRSSIIKLLCSSCFHLLQTKTE